MEINEGWNSPKNILIILAHPDDPEFFLGGTIARWVKAGHRVRYALFTKGDKGAQHANQTSEELVALRIKEQQDAAKSLGAESVSFMDYEDGYIIPDLEMRKEVVRLIRKFKPDILVSCDPLNYFPFEHYINHPDHRYAGQVVIDAVFPAAGNHLFFPELLSEGYPPHEVEEVWLSLTHQPDITLNVTEYWQERIEALKNHRSQIGDPQVFAQYMLDRVRGNQQGDLVYEEKFRRIKFRRKTHDDS